ncbi:type II secretion system protein N [Thalassotalea sp. PLHSN55]|uniref:type II secretion system protein N n=1 Tax=Thalassotalea sp. PLHSN55 TaxID=3435888 RepID=UPI003F86B800
MKKWFAYGAIFLLFYTVFVLATMPASFVLSKVTLPKDVTVQGVSGTIWQIYAEQVTYQQTQLQKVNITPSFWSLLSLNPKLSITFGDAMLPGPEGQLTVSNLLADIHATDIDITVAANMIAEQLPQMVPLTAHNYVQLQMSEYQMGKPVCQAAQGKVTWQKASVTALEETVKLGALSAKLSCDNGALVADVEPNNNLGLSFSAYVRGPNKVSGNGYLTPGDKFPEQVKPLLTFIGKADNQGRYRLNF